MAAISTALLSVLKSGDHIILQDCLYGGTRDFVTKDLPDYGISHSFVAADNPRDWERALRPNTRAIYAETISNPLMQVGELPAFADFAKRRGLVSLIDNTFATPLYFRPAEHGFDLSLHSATKYLNGHTDIVAGVAIGRKALIGKIKHKLDHLGGSLDPHACFLLHRGLKTLGVRVRRQSETALELARFLKRHRAVKGVNYPGLGDKRAKAYLDGFGGMLSFELKGGLPAARRFLKRVTLPVVAPSLGGVESLVTRPATTSHAGIPAAEREALGITESLIRVSVGLEDAADLIADFGAALKA
jgi:cystathionine beta-lyase/cystathionine gamma-synthase